MVSRQKTVNSAAILLYLLVLSVQSLLGQATGIIRDLESGIPLMGVSISTDRESSLSDKDGLFSINLASESSIIISHLGYLSDSIHVRDSQRYISVYLSPSSYNLNPVVVRSPLLHDKIRSMPSSIAVLKKKGLNKADNVSYIEKLNTISGVYVHTGAMNTSRITVRGMGARTPYASNRIKAYYNEIPLTSGDGTTLMEDIDPAFIQTISLIKGAKSALYGSGIGGIVLVSGKNYFKEGIGGGIALEGGSFGTVKPNAWLHYSKNDFSLSTGYSFVHTDGYRENSTYDRHNANLFLSLNKKKLELSFLLLFINVYGFIPSSLDEETFQNSPEKAASNWLSIKGYERYSRILSGLKLNYHLTKDITTTTILYGSLFDAYESRPFNILDDKSVQLGIKSYLTYKKGGFSIRSGIDYMHENYTWSIYETIEGLEGEAQNRFKEIRHPLSIFIQSDLNLSSKLVLEAGLSYNSTNYELFDLYADTVDYSGKHEFTPSVSPFFGLNYKLSERLNVYSSIGHGFSLPSVEETLLPDGQINPDLKPESGINIEAGTRFQSKEGNVYLDGTVYLMLVKDLLLTKRLSEAVFYGDNAGKTEHKGIEIMGEYRFNHDRRFNLPQTAINLSYTYSQNTFTDFVDEGESYTGNVLPGIPAMTFTSNVNIQFRNTFFINLYYQYSGKQYMNDSNTEKYGGFNHTATKIGKTFTTGNGAQIEIYLGINNILNDNYASMILINAPSFGGAAPRYYYPGKPRYVYGGISFKI